MLYVGGLVVLLFFGFWLSCTLDVLRARPAATRHLPKLAWLAVVLVVPVAGGLAWLLLGRPQGRRTVPAGAYLRHPAGGAQPRPQQRVPVGPEDCAEFIAGLRRRLDQDAAHTARLRAWEEDLRRREKELRRRDEDA